MQLAQFPDYSPIVSALRDGQQSAPSKSYRVCVPQADMLLVMESLASKWLESETTKHRAEELITAHNSTYNSSDQYWYAKVRTDQYI